jgi:hypothetical protein
VRVPNAPAVAFRRRVVARVLPRGAPPGSPGSSAALRVGRARPAVGEPGSGRRPESRCRGDPCRQHPPSIVRHLIEPFAGKVERTITAIGRRWWRFDQASPIGELTSPWSATTDEGLAVSYIGSTRLARRRRLLVL